MLLLVALALVQSPSSPTPHWRVVEHTRVTWRLGAPPYELLLEEDDSADYTSLGGRILIKMAGRPVFVFTDTAGPNPFRTVAAALPQDLARRNPITSAHFYLAADLRSSRGMPLLLAFLGQYVDNAGPTLFLGLDATGYPLVIARADIDIRAITDLNGDGVPEVVARQSWSELVGGVDGCALTTYNPLAVHRLAGRPVSSLQEDSTLTRRYNQEHYVWAGPHPPEDIAVKECKGSKFSIVSRPH